jgi:tetratricopeptide (TPR) repeat protein
MAEIFISYARADRDAARRLATYLEEQGLSVWWDMNLEPGQVFRDEIERRIGEARHVIVLWSEASVKARFVLDEAGEAAEQNKLVPLRIDGCKLPLGFREYHTHTVSAWPGDLAPVLAAVGGGMAQAKPAAAPAKTAQDYFDSAEAAYDAGDYGRAIADYSEAMRLKPDYADAYYFRGIAYYGKRDNDRAIADYDQAIRLKPDHAGAYYGRGRAYGRKGDNDRAIADYDQAIRLKPDDADAYAYNNRGWAWHCKGDYARAIGDYDRALQIAPNYKTAAANKARAEAELAKTKKKGWF